jgi:hypothetical protein
LSKLQTSLFKAISQADMELQSQCQSSKQVKAIPIVKAPNKIEAISIDNALNEIGAILIVKTLNRIEAISILKAQDKD